MMPQHIGLRLRLSRRAFLGHGASAVALAAGLSRVLGGWGAERAAAQTGTGGPMKLGLSAPITGNQAQYGQDFREGFELAIATLNDRHLVPAVTFTGVVEDSKSDPQEAANIAQKFASARDILAVVGEFSSTASLAAAPIYQKASIIMMSPTASHPDLTKTGNYIFRTTPLASFEARAVATWAVKDIGVKTVSLIGRNDDYGQVQINFFATDAEANGAKVVSNDLVNPDSKDFKPLITKIRDRHPAATLLAMFQVEAALLLQQSKEMGFTTTFMSGAGLFTPQLIQLAGPAADGLMVVSAFYPGDPNPKVQAFVKDYQAKYGRLPSKFAAHTYDTVMVIADAVRRAKSTAPAQVRDALAATKGYQGVIGLVTIDKDRELVLNLRRLVVKGGQFVPWTK